jgi:DNA-binding transcriptional LysR family regulator
MRDEHDLPSLRQLRAFEAVARRRSIGAAARELGLSQPAVTQMVAQIERALAVSLLERGRTGTYLTALGSVLLPRVQRLFAHIQSALRDPVVGASLSGRETTKSVENKITDTHIRALTAVAECGSFEAAARKLSISQPALHRSARDLERVIRRSRSRNAISLRRPRRRTARRLKVALRGQIRDHGSDRAGYFTARIGRLDIVPRVPAAKAINQFQACQSIRRSG